jgi:hypothetical protein
MYKVVHLSPMIPSYDVSKTAAFFINLLAFRVIRDEGAYVILARDEHMVHILKAGDDIGEMEFYLEVDDVDSVWDGMTSHLQDLEFRAPFNREYGMREIHVVIPETRALLFIGQVLR